MESNHRDDAAGHKSGLYNLQMCILFTMSRNLCYAKEILMLFEKFLNYFKFLHHLV